MLELSYQGLADQAGWEKANVRLPAYDWKDMAAKTEQTPIWVHFGAGNIFRGFIAALQQRLLDEKLKAALLLPRPLTTILSIRFMRRMTA